jgi:hypothetical protein
MHYNSVSEALFDSVNMTDYTRSKSTIYTHHPPSTTTLYSRMFSSPARPIKGTPRRTGTLSRAPRTPSVYSEREHEAIPPPSTARTNRLAHLRRDESPSTSVAETVRTVREVEGYEKISWSRDDRRAVNSLGALPKEVNALVKSLGKSLTVAVDFADEKMETRG